jgi:hypothetical protein
MLNHFSRPETTKYLKECHKQARPPKAENEQNFKHTNIFARECIKKRNQGVLHFIIVQNSERSRQDNFEQRKSL